MWDILRNAQVVVALLASCLSILGTMLAIRGRRRKAARSSGPDLTHWGLGSQSPGASARWSGALDFWDWTLVAGKGLLVGGRNGLVASCCAAPAFGAVLFLLFTFVIPTAVTSASTYFLLVGGAAVVTGVIVGTVSGMNEARREADYQRIHNRIFRQ
jgi:hypothetical protein